MFDIVAKNAFKTHAYIMLISFCYEVTHATNLSVLS